MLLRLRCPMHRLVEERANRPGDFTEPVKRLLKAAIDDPQPFKLHFGAAFQATLEEDFAATARPIPRSMFELSHFVTSNDVMDLLQHYATTG